MPAMIAQRPHWQKRKNRRLFRIHAERLRKHLLAKSSRWPGSKDATTGDTICDPEARPILERIDTYEPVISQAIEADNAAAKKSNFILR